MAWQFHVSQVLNMGMVYRSIEDYYESYFVKAKHFSIWGPANTIMFYTRPDGSGVYLEHWQNIDRSGCIVFLFIANFNCN